MQVTSRSPVLMHLSLWGNYCEVLTILSILSTLTSSELPYIHPSIQVSCLILGHFAFYIPYILRSYRLHIIFNLKQDPTQSTELFHKIIHRTRQSWLVKVYFCILLFPLTLCLFIIIYHSTSSVFPVKIEHSNSRQNTIIASIYIFSYFCEQVLLIFFTNLVKNVKDMFNMKKELLFVCIVWSISPILSGFVETNRIAWFIVCLVRNLVILAGSDLLVVGLAFRSGRFVETLTIEMLGSLELVLENERAMDFFERFLRNDPDSEMKDSGYSMLCLYKEIECRIYSRNDLSLSNIDAQFNKYSVLADVDSSSSIGKLVKSKQSVFKALSEHYNQFLQSDECLQLRKLIHQEEIIAFRVTQTSLLPMSGSKNQFKPIVI